MSNKILQNFVRFAINCHLRVNYIKCGQISWEFSRILTQTCWQIWPLLDLLSLVYFFGFLFFLNRYLLNKSRQFRYNNSKLVCQNFLRILGNHSCQNNSLQFHQLFYLHLSRQIIWSITLHKLLHNHFFQIPKSLPERQPDPISLTSLLISRG